MSSAEESSEPLVIAHRGASAKAPENTIAAFKEAWAQGADGIEGDFRLSADGHIVCVHDKDTKRCADRNLIVAKSSFADLRKLDVGQWKHDRYSGERMPTLAEVLDVVPVGKRFFIELKCGPEIVDPLAETLAAAQKKQPDLNKHLTIIAFDKEVVAACRKRFPEINCNWLVSFKRHKVTGRWGPAKASVIEGLAATKATGLGCSASPEVVDATFVEQLRAADLQFHCWTVDEPALAKTFRGLGVDSITTNEPRAIRVAREAEQ